MTGLIGDRSDFTEELSLRPEGDEDQPFLFRLFSIHARQRLRPAGLDEPVVEQLVMMQHRAQTAGYRAAFPQARFQIIEISAAAVGRLVEADQPDDLYIVDIAFLPEHQGRGLGRRVIAGLMRDQALRGRGVQAQAASDNARSLRLFSGLGFKQTSSPATANVALSWRP